MGKYLAINTQNNHYVTNLQIFMLTIYLHTELYNVFQKLAIKINEFNSFIENYSIQDYLSSELSGY